MFLDMLNKFSHQSFMYFLFEKADRPLSFANNPTILYASWYPISSDVYNSEVIKCNSSSLHLSSLYMSSKETPK